jgi:hypothetical protein
MDMKPVLSEVETHFLKLFGRIERCLGTFRAATPLLKTRRHSLPRKSTPVTGLGGLQG